MHVFVAGATGAVGRRLVQQLIERGHQVTGTSRSAEKAEGLRALAVEAIVLDLLDPSAVRDAVVTARPDAIVHEATALAGMSDIKHFDKSFATTNRLRTEGTDALLAAARDAGAERFVAQSYAGWPYAREGGSVKTEDDPLDPHPVPAMRDTLAAIRYLGSRSSVTAAVSGRSSTWTTRPPRPCSRSSEAIPASTTSSTTSPRLSASGCRRSPRRSAPSHRGACLGGSRASPRASRELR
jgi:nucleoside-diphosphate-sugar epimerase